jgi:hypothetical protein
MAMRKTTDYFVMGCCIFLCAVICTYLNYCLQLKQTNAPNLGAFLTQTFFGPALWSRFPSFPELKFMLSVHGFLLVVCPILGLLYIGRRRQWSYLLLGLAGMPIGLFHFGLGIWMMLHYGDGLMTPRLAIGFGLGLIAILYAAICCMVLAAIDLWKIHPLHQVNEIKAS